MAEDTLAQKMLIIMVSVMVFTALVDLAFISYTGGDTHYYNMNTTYIGKLTGDGTLNTDLGVDYDDVAVEGADSLDADTGNIFTDIFKSVGGWITKQQDKFGFASSILRQPAQLMGNIGIPQFIVTAFAIIWYAMGSLAVLGLLTGRK